MIPYSQMRSEWVPALGICISPDFLSIKFNTITTLIADFLLLIIMLIGLLRLGLHEPDVTGLGRLMWRQVRVSTLLVSCDIS